MEVTMLHSNIINKISLSFANKSDKYKDEHN